MTRPAHLPRKKTIDLIVHCERCSSRAGVKKSYRLDGYLRPRYARLCTRHRTELGYQPVDYTRAHTDNLFREIL